jgi:HEAT repeat protein
LLDALKDEDKWFRMAAAEILGRLGVTDNRVVEVLLDGLKDEDGWVRNQSFNALWSLSSVRPQEPSS